jgi:hypothetical protein
MLATVSIWPAKARTSLQRCIKATLATLSVRCSQSYDFCCIYYARVGVWLERFLKVEENIFVFKMHLATRGVEIFYSAGVVNRGRRIGFLVFMDPFKSDG